MQHTEAHRMEEKFEWYWESTMGLPASLKRPLANKIILDFSLSANKSKYLRNFEIFYIISHCLGSLRLIKLYSELSEQKRGHDSLQTYVWRKRNRSCFQCAPLFKVLMAMWYKIIQEGTSLLTAQFSAGNSVLYLFIYLYSYAFVSMTIVLCLFEPTLETCKLFAIFLFCFAISMRCMPQVCKPFILIKNNLHCHLEKY